MTLRSRAKTLLLYSTILEHSLYEYFVVPKRKNWLFIESLVRGADMFIIIINRFYLYIANPPPHQSCAL